MCIKKVEAWAFDGKTYEREIDAVRVAVENMIGNAGLAETVLGRIGELLPLLDRYATLKRQDAPKKGASETGGKDPEVRDLIRSGIGRLDKREARAFIRDAGYSNLDCLLNRASEQHLNAILAKLVDQKVGGVTLDAQGHDKDCSARLTGFEADCDCGWLVCDKEG